MAKTIDEKHGKLVLVSVVAAISFNFPILHLLGGPDLIAGIPQFYFLLFLIWLGIIILSYLILTDKKVNNGEQNSAAE